MKPVSLATATLLAIVHLLPGSLRAQEPTLEGVWLHDNSSILRFRLAAMLRRKALAWLVTFSVSVFPASPPSTGKPPMAISGCAAPVFVPGAMAAAAAAPAPVAAKPKADPRALAEEARALVAQAETDIQRAHARRALWSKAWEALVGARASLAQDDPAGAIGQARRASELAQLGLEQLAYPATKHGSRGSP